MGFGFGAVVSPLSSVQQIRIVIIPDCYRSRGAVCYTTGATQKQQNQHDSDLPTPRPSKIQAVIFYKKGDNNEKSTVYSANIGINCMR